jgi:hypothetical protein
MPLWFEKLPVDGETEKVDMRFESGSPILRFMIVASESTIY